MKCVFCGMDIDAMLANNPDIGAADESLGDLLIDKYCCSECNDNIVIPARAYLMRKKKETGNQ